jgi:hypothetical protein
MKESAFFRRTRQDKVMGKIWEPHEISGLPAYRLQKRVPEKPKHVFLFGAGASFGSDGQHLFKAGLLPPLGKDLFTKLCANRNLNSWSQLPPEIKSLFESKSFEEAMDYLDSTTGWAKGSFQRDLDLFRYFSQFSQLSSNLYWKLAHLISRRLKERSLSVAMVTLNYDRLLEESLMRNCVFTVVKGVTFYDDDLPQLDDNQLLEVSYPHGACQFFLGHNWFGGEGDVVFGPEARAEQDAGVNHILNKQNIPIACDQKQIPMICRYQSNKRPSVKNYFIDLQQERTSELIEAAESVTIVGVYCAFQTDQHIWNALSQTRAQIHYLEPSTESQNLFREWAAIVRKIEGEDVFIKNKCFKDGFEYIREVNDL